MEYGSVLGFVLMPDATLPDTLCSRADAIAHAATRLRTAGIERPRLEARLLVAHAHRLTAETLNATLAQPADHAAIDALVVRRLAREPIALILGRREFWSLPFEVSPDTLIPRPDSEVVVATALASLPDQAAPLRVLDLGTGTGCLLLALLSERPSATGIGTDLSPAACALAARNASALGLAGRAGFVAADWDAPLAAGFDAILSNPPYIRSGDIPSLMPEVARFEPPRALDGGPDGLDAYRRILASLDRMLAPGGVAVLEVGAGQAADVAALGAGQGFAASAHPDLSGTPRALRLWRAGEKTVWQTGGARLF